LLVLIFKFFNHLFRGGINHKSLTLWKIYEWQSVQKFILTEGEKFVLWRSASLIDQGIYSVVNNLGTVSLIFMLFTCPNLRYWIESRFFSQKGNSLQNRVRNMSGSCYTCATLRWHSTHAIRRKVMRNVLKMEIRTCAQHSKKGNLVVVRNMNRCLCHLTHPPYLVLISFTVFFRQDLWLRVSYFNRWRRCVGCCFLNYLRNRNVCKISLFSILSLSSPLDFAFIYSLFFIHYFLSSPLLLFLSFLHSPFY
jgi:hypothetical protein